MIASRHALRQPNRPDGWPTTLGKHGSGRTMPTA